MFPPFYRAYESLRQALELSIAGAGSQHYLVLGRSGCGKSTVCKMISDENSRYDEEERTVVPVLYCEMPSHATPASIVETLLAELGDLNPFYGTVPNKTLRLVALIKKCGVRLIICDEVQHVPDRGRSRTVNKAADSIKELANKASVPVVLAGLPRSETLNVTNDQLRRRFGAVLWLDRLSNDDKEEWEQFIGIADDLLGALPIDISFAPEEEFDRFYYGSDGRIGYLANLLQFALTQAYASGVSSIDLPFLEDSFRRSIWHNGKGPLNPFHKDFVFRRLDGIEEPFFDEDQPRTSKRKGAHA